jgi:hypothetical protein
VVRKVLREIIVRFAAEHSTVGLQPVPGRSVCTTCHKNISLNKRPCGSSRKSKRRNFHESEFEYDTSDSQDIHAEMK